MKVLHVTPSFYPAHIYGGATKSVYELCRRLLRSDLQLRVLTTDANGLEQTLDVTTNSEVELERHLYVRYCKRISRHSISPTLLRMLPSYIRWADVVHLTAVYSFPTFPTLFLCKLYRKPVIWSPRGALQRWKGSRKQKLKAIWESISRFIIPKKILLHTTSEEEARESLKRFPRVEVFVIPNGIEIPENVAHKNSNDTLRLLYLGRLDPKKGIENLLRACQLLKNNSTLAWTLTIAGSGEKKYSEHIRAYVHQVELTEKVMMIGEIAGEAKKRLFENSDIVVVPSHTENFGVVVAEALAHGVPVIASQGTPWRKLEEKECGLWIENNPDSLSKAIGQMSKMPLQEMGKRGREWMKEEYTWPYVVKKMIQTYQVLLTEK